MPYTKENVMADYVISCCSTADLSQEYFDKRNIRYVCSHFEIDGESYPDDLGTSVPFPEFYRRMAAGSETRTSQISIGEYEDYFRSLLDEGKDVIHMSLSTGITGTYNSARIAAEGIADDYPDRKLYVLDSLAASSGFGMLVDAAADLRDGGADIDTVRDWVIENRSRLCQWMFTTDLEYLIRGGRVGKAEGTVGSLLNICPMLRLDAEGKLVTTYKVRGKKKVIAKAIQIMEETADGGLDYSGKCFVSHAGCLEDAQELAGMIEKTFPRLNGSVLIFDVGTTIGSHAGPGTVTFHFWGKEPRD
jgi:DegV family protein with EDD domain